MTRKEKKYVGIEIEQQNSWQQQTTPGNITMFPFFFLG